MQQDAFQSLLALSGYLRVHRDPHSQFMDKFVYPMEVMHMAEEAIKAIVDAGTNWGAALHWFVIPAPPSSVESAAPKYACTTCGHHWREHATDLVAESFCEFADCECEEYVGLSPSTYKEELERSQAKAHKLVEALRLCYEQMAHGDPFVLEDWVNAVNVAEKTLALYSHSLDGNAKGSNDADV